MMNMHRNAFIAGLCFLGLYPLFAISDVKVEADLYHALSIQELMQRGGKIQKFDRNPSTRYEIVLDLRGIKDCVVGTVGIHFTEKKGLEDELLVYVPLAKNGDIYKFRTANKPMENLSLSISCNEYVDGFYMLDVPLRDLQDLK